MGMAWFDRTDSEKFSAREFSGDLFSPMSANESGVVERGELLTDSLDAVGRHWPSSFGTSTCEVARDGMFTDSLDAVQRRWPSSFRSDSGHSQVCLAPAGTPASCEHNSQVHGEGVIHGKYWADSVKDRFRTDQVTQNASEILQDRISNDCGRATVLDRGASVGVYAKDRLATDSSMHQGSAALPSERTSVSRGVDCSFFDCDRARRPGRAGYATGSRVSSDDTREFASVDDPLAPISPYVGEAQRRLALTSTIQHYRYYTRATD